jgi:hypothetical protein
MPKPMIMFKSVVNGVENFFHFDQACSTEVAKMALLDALKWIGQIEDSAKAEQAKKDAENPVPESAPKEG